MQLLYVLPFDEVPILFFFPPFTCPAPRITRHSFRAMYNKLHQAAGDIKQLLGERERLLGLSNQLRAELAEERRRAPLTPVAQPQVSWLTDKRTSMPVASPPRQLPRPKVAVDFAADEPEARPAAADIWQPDPEHPHSPVERLAAVPSPPLSDPETQDELGALPFPASGLSRPVSHASARSAVSSVSSIGSDVLRGLFDPLGREDPQLPDLGHLDDVPDDVLSSPEPAADSPVPGAPPPTAPRRKPKIRNYNMKDDF